MTTHTEYLYTRAVLPLGNQCDRGTVARRQLLPVLCRCILFLSLWGEKRKSGATSLSYEFITRCKHTNVFEVLRLRFIESTMKVSCVAPQATGHSERNSQVLPAPVDPPQGRPPSRVLPFVDDTRLKHDEEEPSGSDAMGTGASPTGKPTHVGGESGGRRSDTGNDGFSSQVGVGGHRCVATNERET